MASLFLGMLEGMLGLNPAEQATVEPCLPAIKAIVDAINGNADDIWALNEHFCTQQTAVKRMFDDYRKIGPNISQLLGDGWVDISTTLAAAEDLKAAWTANPAVPDLIAIYNRCLPALNTIIANWPKAKPALQIIMTAVLRKGVTIEGLMDAMSRR